MGRNENLSQAIISDPSRGLLNTLSLAIFPSQMPAFISACPSMPCVGPAVTPQIGLAHTLKYAKRPSLFQTARRKRKCTIQAMVTGAEAMLFSMPNAAMLLSVTSPALEVGKLIAGPGINIFNFVMILRIILTWYPQTNLTKVPWIFIAVPTEPLLRATRKVIQPIGGVDISPIVWFAIMSFVHEILVGPQGLFVLMSQK